jgi:hypothetical protein
LLILPSPQQQQISRLLCRRRLNSNKGTKILTGFFRIFYARRTFGNSAAPKIDKAEERYDRLWVLRTNTVYNAESRMHRIMNALVPASVKRTMTAKLLGKALARKPAPANARAEA